MKSVVTMSIDSEIIIEARKRNLNVSSICNETLRQYMEMNLSEKPKNYLEAQEALNTAKIILEQAQQEFKKLDEKTITIKGDKIA